jgi:5-methylcytosine-specific restriction endonuclease McrA
MNNKELFFLNWFFRGDFFSSLKESIENNVDNESAAFKAIFFDNERVFIDNFLAARIPKTSKEKIGVLQCNYINEPHMIYIKQLLLESNIDVVFNKLKNRLNKFNAIIQNSEGVVSKFMLAQYSKFRKSKGCILYVKNLNGQVCQYCDKGIIDCTDLHFYGDLDHFLNKASNYCLALNIANLVPCCKVCNQLKGTKKVNFNPGVYSLDDVFYFKISEQFLSELITNFDVGDTIKIELKKKEKAEQELLNNLDNILLLSDRYKNCGSIINYLVQLKRVYSKSYLNDISNLLSQSYDEDEIKRFLLGFYNKNSTPKIQPLTKLVNDIATQINLFKNFS